MTLLKILFCLFTILFVVGSLIYSWHDGERWPVYLTVGGLGVYSFICFLEPFINDPDFSFRSLFNFGNRPFFQSVKTDWLEVPNNIKRLEGPDWNSLTDYREYLRQEANDLGWTLGRPNYVQLHPNGDFTLQVDGHDVPPEHFTQASRLRGHWFHVARYYKRPGCGHILSERAPWVAHEPDFSDSDVMFTDGKWFWRNHEASKIEMLLRRCCLFLYILYVGLIALLDPKTRQAGQPD